MRLFSSSLALLGLVVMTAKAAPTPSHSAEILKFPPLLCPRQAGSSLTVNTPLGVAHGAADNSGSVRFAVKYADHQRWKDSTVVKTWQLPNGQSDPSAMPKACPQPDLDSSAFAEDCLSMVLYVPASVHQGSKAPTLMWIHGGSFAVGSANGPGLDGSNLATATNSIVAVIQYRLGALGFHAPNGPLNLAVKDTIHAMQFLQKVLPSFGGDASQITIAGQSAGASMIRTLLGTPSANNLFKSAILQSDTMDYGLYTTGMQQTLQNFFNSQLTCGVSDSACLNSLSLDAILQAQDNLSNQAPGLVPAANQAEPIRPTRDGTLVTSPLDSTAQFPSVNKPLLITTVRNEAGFTIYGGTGGQLDPPDYEFMVNAAFGDSSAKKLLAFPDYAVPPSTNTSDGKVITPNVVSQLSQMGTDQVWRCPSWTFARNWVSHGGKAYVGEYFVGASYPGNDAVAFCTQSGVVCHQDDIEIVFGTVPNPNSAQSALIKEMQARYSAFLRTGNPNTGSLPAWTAAGTSDVHPIQLGGSGEAPVGGCDPTFWGAAVPFDYQTFGI
ncbi:alpha/beta-hydrolase [Panus rudis PR-1116 ss-1]|nr:alpha/beta-hydrolase [Panus rudis PR-1116 ss-1]